jgi:GTP-binding protein YchF
MQIGLIGFQNSGKTTLFQTLISGTSGDGKASGSRSVVKVPDARLDKLTGLFNPKSEIHTTLEFLDVTGLTVSDEGKVKITADFINTVKNCDALIHVVRQFKNDAVPHPEETINPARDIEFFETEFLLSDMSLAERRLERIEKEIQKNKNEQLQRELPVFKKILAHLESEQPLRTFHFDPNELKTLSGYQFLCGKPLIIGVNLDEDSKDSASAIVEELENRFGKDKFPIFPFFAQFEYELAQLPAEEAEVFKSDFGISESAMDKILRTTYRLLGLQSFFTVGEDECRAWTIRKNMTAQEAAGVIHTDFFAKFIRAEVVHYDDYLKYGSFAKCKDSGVWRLEGKDYIVKDGDILNIRHS